MNRRERKKEQTRLHIIEEAMRLFREKGFDDTAMEQIASKADISKATLYKYFPVKEAIIADYWKARVRQENNLVPKLIASVPDTKSRLSAVFLSAAAIFKQEPEFARIQFRYQFQEIGKQPSNGESRSGFEGFLEELLKQGQLQKDVRSDIPVSDMAGHLLFLFTSTCLFWFSQPDLFPLEEKLNQTIKIFIEGVQHA